MKDLKYHPGMWMRDDAADAMNALEDKYGPIRINRAGVPKAEQQRLIDRWNMGGTYNRPPYLYPPANPAESSEHVQGTAADVYNYTSDRAKLQEFGFVWYGPKDPVHYMFRGVAKPADNPQPAAVSTIAKSLRWYGIQAMLKVNYGYTGAIDNIPGTGTITAFQRFLNRNGYGAGAEDGIAGNQTWDAAQRWLRAKWNYQGAIDHDFGPGSRQSWATAENKNWLAFHKQAGV